MNEVAQALELLAQHEVSHFHCGEPEARVMKCGPTRVLAFNAQAVVDHESDLCVAIDVVTAGNDNHQLVHMVDKTTSALGRPAGKTLADGGYASGLELQKAEKRRLPVLVHVPESSPRPNGVYPKSSFTYDSERDVYICPQQRELRFARTDKASRALPFEQRLYRCQPEGCPVRAKCTTAKVVGRTIKRAQHDDVLDRARKQLDDVRNRKLYMLRAAIIEHLFGNVKGNDGFRRFTVRGLRKVKAQWALAATAVNLRKLRDFWVDGRFSLRASSAQIAA